MLTQAASAAAAVPDEVADWEKKRGEYQRQLGPLVAAIKGSSINPVSLECTHDIAQLTETTIACLESECLHKTHTNV